MATSPDVYRHELLQKLYNDALKGRGTDMEVSFPDKALNVHAQGTQPTCTASSSMSTTTFHLHWNIASANSGYFATFPEPRTGRVIRDIDSETFRHCVQFMYLGESSEFLARDNVASILHAAELLQFDALKDTSVKFLDSILDHSNYEHVVELADRFNICALRVKASRYSSENSARDELVKRKASLTEQIKEAAYEEAQSAEKKKRLSRHLEDTEEQWKLVVQKELESIAAEKRTVVQEGDGDLAPSFSYPSDQLKQAGTIGHLVVDGYYSGSSTYKEGLAKERNGSDDDDSYSSAGSGGPPPPPTKEQYTEYGIVHSHCSIKGAMKAAGPGDRIYISPGKHKGDVRDSFVVNRGQEFIGLGNAEEVVIEKTSDGKPLFYVFTGPVRFHNITFRVTGSKKSASNSSHPGICYDRVDDSIIEFEDDKRSDEPNAELFVDNCVFDLGLDCSHSTRVSGLYLKRGGAALVQGCRFLGGGGSAIAVVNDPYFHIPKVEILGNSFVSNGQPSFHEKSMLKIYRGLDADNPYEYKPIPANEIPPGPASVELFKFKRQCFRSRRFDQSETHKITSVRLSRNIFTSNLRAPLAYRMLLPAKKQFSFGEEERKAPTWELHKGSLDEIASNIIKEYKLAAHNNTMKDNGLQFDKEQVVLMANSAEREAKKPRLENECKGSAFPDGETLLVIHQYLHDYDEGFPENWEYGEPVVNFKEDYFPDVYGWKEEEDSYSGFGW